ncbi:lipopolysaccharide N-acetylglucosaminyl transferase [Herminiimonas sp.]|uniref:lipopolysaccharide N-acetylglucosaminyl transferase n=1 Tax=Herminiimonas sp. TaxID=1926289 RepID=UPI00272D406C|nr:lipopolysaccharide N-acetylglucosaminyl transferase [Herminiimonas sp.]
MQIAFALIVAFASLKLLPSIYREQSRSVAIYLFILSLAIPLGGMIVCVAAIFLAYRFPIKPEITNIVEVSLPAFETTLIERIKHGAGARMRVQLENRNAPVADRLTALLAMQSIPKRTASPILREFLWDSVEDVRLLMYAMLDSAEKDITQKIHIELRRLAKLSDDGNEKRRYITHMHLAQLHWELVYQNLVQDDIYTYTVAQADLHAAQALVLNANNASLWNMRGRLALVRHQPEEAELHLQRAAEAGFPSDRLLPFFAECAYLQKDYASVRSALNAFENRSTLPFLQPLQRYWTS